MKIASVLPFTLFFCALQQADFSPASVSDSGQMPIFQAATRVPFVGCKSESRGDPVAEPTGDTRTAQIPAQIAERLAYYRAKYGYGVLAPRGWYCFGLSGTSGSTLFVSPKPINTASLISDKWSGLSSPGIAIRVESGSTFGRFGVAQVIGRVFPAHISFTDKVANEGTLPVNSFPRIPYPHDRLVYRSKEVVEFQTSANYAGLGTVESGFKPTELPISGVAILVGDTPDLVLLSVRLAPPFSSLTPEIIQQVEHDVAFSKE